MWISNAPEADVYTVFARTTPDTRAQGVTAFVVPGDAEGLSGEHLDLLAPHAIGHLSFDGVRVTSDDVLGEVDAGFAVAMRTLDLFRPSVGAFAVGMAQAALDAAVTWSTEREVHGGPLSAQQSVEHTLGEMATRVQASRLLVRAAASSYDAGADPREVTTSAAMAKLFATETAQWVVDQALQLHGARGLQRGHLLEHLYREVRAPRIYEGASEVQRTIIGRALVRSAQDAGGSGEQVRRVRVLHRGLAALPLRGRGRRRDRHAEPAGEAQPADLRVVRRPPRPARTSCRTAATPTSWSSAARARASAAAATSTRSSAS